MTAAANPCPTCGKPIADTGYLCHECSRELKSVLLRIGMLHRHLDITITRRDRIGEPGRSTAEAPLPFNWRASHAKASIDNMLTTWARHVEAERDQPVHVHGTWEPPVECALWLAVNVPWMRHRPEVTQVYDEARDALNLLRRTIDRPPARRYVGPCDTCHADMYADPWVSETSCPKGCAGTYAITDRVEWLLEQADDQLAHAGLLARAITDLGEPIKSDRIRQWAARGRLVSRGTDPSGRALYSVRDVRGLLHDDQRREALKKSRSTHVSPRGTIVP